MYFIVEEGDWIRLLTFIWHTPGHCDDLRLVEVNRFDKIKKKWKSAKFEIKKYETFHGCQLVIGVDNDYPASWISDGYDRHSCGGYHLEMIEGLMRHLNFTIEYNILLPDNTYGKNLSTDYTLRRSSYNFNYILQNDYWSRRFVTQPFIFTRVTMAVPPGAIYNGYEKLFLPFDWQTWSLILFTFFGSFLTIFVVNFTTINIRKLVFGSNVTTPSLNVAAHFFDISQPTLPRGNFGRILLTIFIFYCLIIRTAWQGKMFEFLQKEMRKPEIQSIEEMIERNFSFCMWYDFMQYYGNMDIAKR